MSLQNIPNELRLLRQWVCAGADKVPINPRTGDAADPTDPETWGSFAEACQAGRKHVGFVLSKDDPYSIIDLDAPITEAMAERHQQILEAAESYAEISQSGGGVHIILRGKVPHGVRRDKVEVYSQDRYMICTGNVLNPLPIDDNQFLLDVLFKEMATTRSTELIDRDDIMTDDDLVAMGRKAENGRKFQQLWDGDWDKDWPSQSEADLALMSMLCYYSKSNEQCRRVFRLSALGQRPKADRDKYLNYMVEKCRAKEPPPTDLTAIRNGLNTKRNPPPPPKRQAATAQSILEEGSDGGSGEDNGVGEAGGAPADIAPAWEFEYPPGLIGDLADYFHSSAIRPVKEIALASAVALTAGISGRSYNISGTGLNQYLILLARTGSGKEGIASGINKVVAALRPSIPMADRFIGPATFASGQALIRCLDERPCFVSILGEVGHTIQQLSDPRINDAQRQLKKVLLDLYNKSGFSNVLHPSAYSDNTKNTKMVHAPNVTIMGESTPDVFFGGLDAAQVVDGLLPRFSIIEYNGPRPARNRNAFHEPPESLLNDLGNLMTTALTTMQNTTCQPVALSAEAVRVLDELDDYATEIINQSAELERHLWNRAHLKALKLSALLAVGLNPQGPIVDKASAEWARDFVFNDVQILARRFALGDVGEGHSKQEVDLYRAIMDYSAMTPSTRKGYKVPDKLLKESNVVPYHYLRRRLRLNASFKNDRRGFNVALNELLDNMVRAEVLQVIDRKLAMETFGATQGLYARGACFG